MLKLVRTNVSANERTRVYTFKAHDGRFIRSSSINNLPVTRSYIARWSTMDGCPMTCNHCISRVNPVKRKLDADEQFAQFLAATEYLHGVPSNTPFLCTNTGEGDGLGNLEASAETIRMIARHNENHLQRPITAEFSTSGISPVLIRMLGKQDLPIDFNFQFSFHASNDAARWQIVPTPKDVKVNDLLEAIHDCGVRNPFWTIVLNYIPFVGLNDQPQHAEEAALLLKKLGFGNVRYQVKLSQWNKVENPEFPYEESGIPQVKAFCGWLLQLGIPTVIRDTGGNEDDVQGGCGTLMSSDTIDGTLVQLGKPS